MYLNGLKNIPGITRRQASKDHKDFTTSMSRHVSTIVKTYHKPIDVQH